MSYRVLCLTDCSDLPETELFIGLKNAGVDIEVACNPSGRYFDRLCSTAVPVYELIAKSRFSWKAVRSIQRILHNKSYDILYCFNNKAISNLLLATRENRYRIVTYRGTIGNISFLSPASWTSHLNPRVDRIVCVSEAVRQHLETMRFLCWGFPAEKAVTIYKGHDLAWYQQTPADLNTEFGLPSDAFVVGFAGRSRPHKGICYLIEAAQHLPPDAPIHFLLLGRLEKDKALNRLIAESPYRDRIHLTGFRNDAPAVFAACNTFVMPSTKREGLSRAVIEAMSYATPPIVTDVGGLPELVADGQSGYVVPPENAEAIAKAIFTLYSKPAAAHQMGLNAQHRIRTTFNTANTIEQTIALFDNLMK